MTANGTEFAKCRGEIQQATKEEPRKQSGVLAALLRAPIAVADVDFARPREEPRNIIDIEEGFIGFGTIKPCRSEA